MRQIIQSLTAKCLGPDHWLCLGTVSSGTGKCEPALAVRAVSTLTGRLSPPVGTVGKSGWIPAQRAASTWVDRFILSGTTACGCLMTERNRSSIVRVWLDHVAPERVIACCWSRADVDNAAEHGVTPIVVIPHCHDDDAALRFLASLPPGSFVYSHRRGRLSSSLGWLIPGHCSQHGGRGHRRRDHTAEPLHTTIPATRARASPTGSRRDAGRLGQASVPGGSQRSPVRARCRPLEARQHLFGEPILGRAA